MRGGGGARGMMGGGGGGGGGGGSGGDLVRLVGRRVAARGGAGVGVQDPATTSPASNSSSCCTSPTGSSKTHKKLTASISNNIGVSSGSPFSAPISAGNSYYYGWPSAFTAEDYEWVSVSPDGSDEEMPPPPHYDDEDLLGHEPSPEEVNAAVSALTQLSVSCSQFVRDKYAYSADKSEGDQFSNPTGILRRVASVGAELDWLEPSPDLCNTRMLQAYGSDRVYDAFHLLQTDPSVQRMVISLSSDRAVWDAVLNNEAVRELREKYYSDNNVSLPSLESSDETQEKSNPALNVLKWILDSARAKFVEVFETITKLVNDLFEPPDDEKATGANDQFEKRLRTSFLLSIMVLLIVVVTRAHRA